MSERAALSADLSTALIDTVSYLDFASKIMVGSRNNPRDRTPLASFGERMEPGKYEMVMDWELQSTSSTVADMAASGFDVSALTVMGVTSLADLLSGSLQLVNTIRDVGGATLRQKYPQVTRKALNFDARLRVQLDGGNKTLPVLGAGSAGSLDGTVGLGFNGVTYTVPILLSDVDHEFDDDGIQVFGVKTRSHAALPSAAAAFPTAPTTGTSPFVKGILTPNVAFAIDLINQATNGQNVRYQGNFIAQQMTLNIPEDGLTLLQMQLISQGAVTVSNPSA